MNGTPKSLLKRFVSARSLRFILLPAAAACLCLLCFLVLSEIREARNAWRMEELRHIGSDSSASAASLPSMEESAKTMLPGLATLYAKNNDLAGWVSIEGTAIDYPVMFTPQDEDYYLNRNFDRKQDKNGSLLIQKDCDPFTVGTNVIIHGHNMKNGKMFGDLEKYKDEAYCKQHPVVRFNTLYAEGKYEIIAAFYSKVYRKNDKVFKYYRFLGAKTQAEFDDYVANTSGLALYDTGVTAKFGDSFVTLSTCSYQTENGRFVVVARKEN